MPKQTKTAQQGLLANRLLSVFSLGCIIVGAIDIIVDAIIMRNMLSGPPDETQWAVFILPPFLLMAALSIALICLAMAMKATESVQTFRGLVTASLVILVLLALPIIGALEVSLLSAVPFLVFIALFLVGIKLRSLTPAS